jgi:hypothetical protein
MRPNRQFDSRTGSQFDPPSVAFTECKEERFDASDFRQKNIARRRSLHWFLPWSVQHALGIRSGVRLPVPD